MPERLAVIIRGEADGPPLGREPVTRADLADAMAETWRDQCLRGGFPQQPLYETPMTLLPRRGDGETGSRCEGFTLEIELSDGRHAQQEFGLSCLEPVAARAATALINAGNLSPEAGWVYEVAVEPSGTPATGVPDDSPMRSTTVRSGLPPCLRVSYRSLLRRATALGVVNEDAFPVFFTGEAQRKAEACSRLGANAVPPVESGGMLVGTLACCDVTKEFFAIVLDALELEQPEQTTFSLTYTGQSWSRIQAIMKARQAAYPERGLRLLGQCHGHNFVPNNGRRCAECDKRPVCGLTSVFVSGQDRLWMSAVYARQPWALCQIFGLNVRQEPVHQLYSLKDACWQSRGYFLLPEFDWDPKALRLLQTKEQTL